MNDEQMNWKVNNIPPKHRKNYEKALDTNSQKEAIKAKCLDCMNFDTKMIKTCDVTWCPLWTKRPYNNQNKVQKASKTGGVSTLSPVEGSPEP